MSTQLIRLIAEKNLLIKNRATQEEIDSIDDSIEEIQESLVGETVRHISHVE